MSPRLLAILAVSVVTVACAGAVSAFDDPIVIHITGPGMNAKYIKEGDAVQQDVAVKVGQSVIWKNDTKTTKSHTASATTKDAAGKRVFDTGSISVGDSAQIDMTKALYDGAGGTAGGQLELEYICTIHGANAMKSKIVLADSAAGVPFDGGDNKSNWRKYDGTSKKGDFSEALQLAIANAKSGLHTDLVSWSLVTVSGVNGGFVRQNDLTVTILAISGPGGKTNGGGAKAER
jgi:plastocyanin